MTNAKIKTRLVDVGKQVRHVRLAVGISQRELGRRSQVGYRFISELEQGKENPSLATVVRIADGLGCEVGIFFQPTLIVRAN